MTFADYKALDAVNWSTLRHMQDSPAHYRAALAEVFEPTAAMQLGTAAHTAILEPERLAESVAVWSEGRRAGKAYDAFVTESAGRLILKPEEYADVIGMRDAVHCHPRAAGLLLHGLAEQSIRWTDPTTGIACKGRLDWLSLRSWRDANTATIIDLKTTRTTDARAFSRQCASLGYHLQLAHYAMGVEASTGVRPEVYIIAVESAAPYDVLVLRVGEDVLGPAREVVTGLLVRLAECRASGRWPGRHPEVEPLTLPGWATRDTEEPADGPAWWDGSESLSAAAGRSPS